MNLGAICSSETSHVKGTYTIILANRRRSGVRFGKLGYAKLTSGYYLYTGSALGRGSVSLENRLARHFRSAKTIRWHIDYLTTHPTCKVIGALYLKSNRHLECAINKTICENLQAQPVLPNIGASDCGCKGHLLRPTSCETEADLLEALRRVYSRFGMPMLL